MYSRSAARALEAMADDDQLTLMEARYERRLGEESGKLQLAIADLRAETINRNAELLKWLLAFFVAQTAALAALLSHFR